MPELLKVLKSPQRQRVSKLHALQSLSDLAIYCPIHYAELYLKDTLVILQQAGQISLTPVNVEEDPELGEYMQELRTNVINCYTTVIGAAKDSNLQNQVMTEILGIMNFLQQCVQNQYGYVSCVILNPLQSIYFLVTGLLGDIANCCGKQISQLL